MNYFTSSLSYYLGYSDSVSQSTPTGSTTSSNPQRGTADFSSISSQPEAGDGKKGYDSDDEFEENITALYSQNNIDTDYFNLGASSFPLLPHSLDLLDESQFEALNELLKRTSASSFTHLLTSSPNSSRRGSHSNSSIRSAHHFTSILNDPAYDDESDALTTAHVPPPPTIVDPFPPIQLEEARWYFDSLTSLNKTFISNHLTQEIIPNGNQVFSYHKKGNKRIHPSHADCSRTLSLSSNNANAEMMVCLASIPPRFLSSDFSLAAEESLINGVSGEESAAIQGELQNHLDQVEVTLFKQISIRSHLFFTALEKIQSLNSEIATSVATIGQLRSHCTTLDASVSQDAFHTMKLITQRDNIQKLITLCDVLETLHKSIATIKLLIEAGDFVTAVEFIVSARSAFDNEVKGVKCLHGMESQLDAMMKLMVNLVQTDFVTIVWDGSNFQSSVPSWNEMLVSSFFEDAKWTPRDILAVKLRLDESMNLLQSKIRMPIRISRAWTEDERVRVVSFLQISMNLGEFPTMMQIFAQEFTQRSKKRVMDSISNLLEIVAAMDGVTEEGLNKDTELNPNSINSQLTGNSNHINNELTPIYDASTAASMAKSSRTSIITRTISPLPPSTSPLGDPIASSITVASPVSPDSLVDIPSKSVHKHKNPNSSLSASTTLIARIHRLSHRPFFLFMSNLYKYLMDPIIRAHKILPLILHCYTVTSSAIKKMKSQANIPNIDTHSSHIQSENTSNSDNDTDIPLSEEAQHIRNEYIGVLMSSCDYFHNKCSKILNARNTVHAELTLEEFREILDSTLGFIHEAEKIGSKSCFGLRGILLMQAKSFVNNFHKRNMQELSIALESEKWNRVDVPYEYQDLLDSQFLQKLDIKPFSNASTAEVTNVLEDEEKLDDEFISRSETKPNKHSLKREHRKVLFVSKKDKGGNQSTSNYEKYAVVGSLLTLFSLVSSYVQLVTSLPAVATDILTKLLELLTLYNSRACQLVLGAGAMHCAGLKSITATHMALSSQAVTLLAIQTEALRNVFKAYLPPKQQVFVSGFDRVARDCEEHAAEISAKLTAIMKELVDNCIKKTIDRLNERLKRELQLSNASQASGGAAAPSSSKLTSLDLDDDVDNIDKNMQLLMRQTASLNRALTDLFNTSSRDEIFQAVCEYIRATILSSVRELFEKYQQSEPAALRLLAATSNSPSSTRLYLLTTIDFLNARVLSLSPPSDVAIHSNELISKFHDLLNQFTAST